MNLDSIFREVYELALKKSCPDTGHQVAARLLVENCHNGHVNTQKLARPPEQRREKGCTHYALVRSQINRLLF